MKSLILYNIITQHITYLTLLKDGEIDEDFFTFAQAGWRNGDVVCCINGDYRDKTNYELKCLCREILLSHIEKEINPFGG